MKWIGLTVPEISTLLYHPSPYIFQSDHYQIIHLRHGLRTDTDTTTTHFPVFPGHCRCYCQCTDSKDSINKPAHLWLELPRCIPFLLPYFAIPWRTGSSSTALLPDSKDHLRYVFAALGTKSLEMHAQWMPTGSEEEQKVTKAKASAFLNRIQQGMTHDVNTHVHLGELEDIVAQARRGPPRSCHMHQDPDGLLRDDQWWASWAQTMSLHRPCIPPWGEAARKTYGQAIQDTLQWAGWNCCEPLHHPACQGTSLPQHQTCGHNPPGPKADSPHQPRSYTICTLQGLSQLHPTAPSWQSKLPSTWLLLFQMWQNGTLGTQMPWWQATPIKECTATWGHSRGSPDAHLGTKTPTKGGRTRHNTIDVRRGPQPSRWDSPTPHPTQHNYLEHSPQRDHGQRCTCATMQWGLHHHTAAYKCQQKGNSLTPC